MVLIEDGVVRRKRSRAMDDVWRKKRREGEGKGIDDIVAEGKKSGKYSEKETASLYLPLRDVFEKLQDGVLPVLASRCPQETAARSVEW